ncbi:MAG: isoprenylcysteine carboxylmethyltransferase family protein [Chloroflexi bacterium]|nr:isoprenylcysteine carboxylmethyltransferase family protein [Chloroflexota bacterium]
MSEAIVFVILLGTYLLCLTIRSSYELLKRAHRVDPNSAVVFGVVFTAMCVLWVSWFSMCPVDPSRLTPPEPLRWLAGAAVVAATAMALVAVMQLRGLENIDHLVTTGVFAKIRHPMYLGFILWIVGWGVSHGALISLIAGLIEITNILFWRGLEEAHLESRYGDAYRKYRMATWF